MTFSLFMVSDGTKRRRYGSIDEAKVAQEAIIESVSAG